MKGFRGTLIFAIVVAAVVGLSVWQYKHSAKEAEEKTIKASLFHELKAADVVEYDFTGPKGSFKIKGNGSDWQIVAPFQDRANGDYVKSNITSIFGQSVVSPESGGVAIDWSKFGLVDPEETIVLHFRDGKTQTLKVGRVRTYDDGYYLRRNNEPDLLVGDRGWDGILSKTVEDFRYKKPEIPPADIQTLTIRSLRKGKLVNFTIAQKDGVWSIVGHPDIRIATSLVNQWINSIRDLTADTVVSDTKASADLKKYKLSHPEIEFDLAYENPAKTKHVIAISGATKGGEVHWYSTDNPAIYEMSAGKTDILIKTPDDLRDLGFVFAFDQDQAAHLTYDRVTDASTGHAVKPVTPIHIALDKVNGEWTLHKADPKKNVDQVEVKNFLTYLRGLKASKFLKQKVAQALKENDVEIKNEKGDVIYHLQWGGSLTDKLADKAKIEYYAAKANVSNEYFEVTKATLDELANKKLIDNLPGYLTPKTGRVNETKTIKGKE